MEKSGLWSKQKTADFLFRSQKETPLSRSRATPLNLIL